MENLGVTPALLCLFCCLSVSLCDFTVEVLLPGQEVTLLCSYFSGMAFGHINWFRMTNSDSSITPISRMLTDDGNVTLSAGFETGKFTMTSNRSRISLNIKAVDSSDFGLYLCGYDTKEYMAIYNATYLRNGETFHDSSVVIFVILGGLIVFLTIIIIIIIIIIKRSARDKRVISQSTQNEASDGLNYAALSFQPRTNGGRRQASERELETDVVYAAAR